MTNAVKHVVIGTAGHIDHGKTALVRALTGIDTDRLPEEKRRGITIDLGFASMNASAPDSSLLQISFVDVPGHKLFIRNMLAGAGCIDAVLLVISAEEGVKPQTEEHLAICSLLGVRQGLTVITKIDALSPGRVEEISAEIKTFLSGTFLDINRSRILPVSAHTGQGLGELRREIISLGMKATVNNPDHLARLPLDRAFVMRGFGTVVTGTLLSGEFRTGETITLEPGSRSVRIRGMQTHGRSKEHVCSGSRVALNLSGVEVSEAKRGQTLVPLDTLAAVTTVDVEASLLSRSSSLKHRSRVHFHAFTSDTLATASLYGCNIVEAGTDRFMRLRLDKPVVLLPGDRFVLRQCSPASTIGGGRVLDAHPFANLSKAKCLTWLKALKEASLEEQLFLRVLRRGAAGLAVRELMAETGITRQAIDRLTEPLVSGNRLLRITSDTLLSTQALATAMGNVAILVKPDGIKRSELRGQSALNPEVFDFVIENLAREERLRLQDERVLLPGSESHLPDEDLQLHAAIASIYEAAGLAAPAFSEVAARLGLKEADMRRPMTTLLHDKILVKMSTGDLYIHNRALEQLRATIREFRGHRIDVARFKQITGLSRKYAIPLLEYLDRQRITYRDNDQRLVL